MTTKLYSWPWGRKIFASIQLARRCFKRDRRFVRASKLVFHVTNSAITHPYVQVHDLKVELKNIKAGLHSTSRFIQEPKQLKESIKALYRKHLQDYDKVN